MFKLVGIVMTVAPIGIGAAIAVTVGRSGLGVLRNLGALVLTLYASLIAFALVVLLPIAVAFKVPIRRFWRATKEPWLIAFTTASQAAGIQMPVSRQLLMMLTLMLTSKGLAAVPRASLVVLSGTLAQFGLPLQGVAVILGVDALMDMARTSLNVVGNCLAAVLMARWEGTVDL